MNDFTAKKLGEVLAFLRLAGNTFEQGKTGFDNAGTAERVAEYTATIQSLATQIESLAQASGKEAVTTEKTSRTLAKVTIARDDYIAGRWDDAVELYEWLSFNAGAGTAHASEVEGAAAALQHKELQSVNHETMTFFDTLLIDCKQFLNKVGAEKAVL